MKNYINTVRRFGSKLRYTAPVALGGMVVASSASAADGDWVAAAVTAITAGATQQQLIFAAIAVLLVALTVWALCKRAL
jgi:hypothetical protein